MILKPETDVIWSHHYQGYQWVEKRTLLRKKNIYENLHFEVTVIQITIQETGYNLERKKSQATQVKWSPQDV